MEKTDQGGGVHGSEAESSRYNFAVMLGNGSFVDLAKQLSNPQVVLPFLYSAFEAPLALAGLIVPLNNLGMLFGKGATAPLISSARSRKWYMGLGSLAVAVFLALLGFFVQIIGLNAVAAIFLLVAAAVGISQGLGSVAFQDVLGRTLPENRRGPLLFTQTAVGGVLAIVASWGIARIFQDAKPLNSHMTLIWASAAALVLAFVFSIMTRETPTQATGAGAPGGFVAGLRRGFTLARRSSWFGRFMVGQLLLLSVTLATTFYSIHAASLHQGKAGSLSAFVIFSSLGLVVGGPLWSWLVNKGFRLLFICGGLATISAAVLALIIENFAGLQSVLVHAPVFLLATLGFQAVMQGRQAYVVNMTSDEERPFFISVFQTLLGIFSIVVAALFGFLAHIQGAEWPVMAILVLNIVAVIYVFFVPVPDLADRARE